LLLNEPASDRLPVFIVTLYEDGVRDCIYLITLPCLLGVRVDFDLVAHTPIVSLLDLSWSVLVLLS